MRDVKSGNYFEQMKGRGTRTLDCDSLRKVTPSATTAKTHFVIVDAVGVIKSRKTASRPLITKPSVPMKDLAMAVMMGAYDADTVGSLAARLARLDRQLEDKDRARLAAYTNGVPLTTLVGGLMMATDPDRVEAKARAMTGADEPTEAQYTAAQRALVDAASTFLTGELITLLKTIRRDTEQTIDHINLDEVTRAEWEGDATDNAKAMTGDFESYLAENRDSIEALTIFYAQPHRRREVTFAMISGLIDRLRADRPILSPVRVWQSYTILDDVKGKDPISELAALIAAIRRACGIDAVIAPYACTVRRNFQTWIMRWHSGNGDKFTPAQMEWLHMIRDHIATSFHIERDDLQMAPFDAKGGLGKMYLVFGDRMDALLDEINEALAATNDIHAPHEWLDGDNA